MTHPPNIPLAAAPKGRCLLLLLIATLLSITPVSSMLAADDLPDPTSEAARQRRLRAVQSGVAYIIAQQDSEGAITDRKTQTAMSSLAVLALAAAGHQPTDKTPEGVAMRLALEFVLRDENQTDEGYFGRKDGSRMYGHGIITLMLSEMLGMSLDPAQEKIIRNKLVKAVQLIVRAQRVHKGNNHQGGWRYMPDSKDSDLSVTVWQVMALRSAESAGIEVPQSAIHDAVEYLKRLYCSDRDEHGKPKKAAAPFGYERNHHQAQAPAAGLLALQVCGLYEAPEVIGSADWHMEHPPESKMNFLFYQAYYYATGMHLRGGKYADRALAETQQLLLNLQRDDGSWLNNRGNESQAGAVYSTSLAVIALSVDNYFLPIYQR
ncbi:hypothetical protein HED60_00015 [Planctomycetales bacterium ZRK34]|nr:hypothetical protein HED60_00015 [Planctomycetales bacterium ZRK34]